MRLIRWVRALLDAARALVGYIELRRTGLTPPVGRVGLVGLFTAHPRLPSAIARAFSIPRRTVLRAPVSGVVGRLDSDDLSRVVATLQRDGLFVFPTRLDPVLLDDLAAVADTLPSFARLTMGGPVAKDLVFDPAQVVASVYDYDQSELMSTRPVQIIACDAAIAAIADGYLRCNAPLTDVAMWRSPVNDRDMRWAAAQLFHSDRDHLRFVKFFVYLTDVTPVTGPHVFVRRSHRIRPVELRRPDRFSDEEVNARYSADDIVEICGPRGTVFVADTSGLHKGKVPEQSGRLVLSLQFGSGLFPGSAIPSRVHPRSDAFAEAVSRDRRKFRRFVIA